jgi:hypothetical protein
MCQNRPYSLGGIEVAMSILLPVREQIALSDQPRDILFSRARASGRVRGFVV